MNPLSKTMLRLVKTTGRFIENGHPSKPTMDPTKQTMNPTKQTMHATKPTMNPSFGSANGFELKTKRFIDLTMDSSKKPLLS